jgi:hypothetical protein
MGAPLGPIQVIPPGLVGLLQLKQLGRLPDNLLGDVNPVLELRDWYMEARRVSTVTLFGGFPATAAITTGGVNFKSMLIGGVNAAVPQGQIWYVEEFTVSGSIATAADSISFAAAMSQSPLTDIQLVGPPYIDVITARARAAAAKADRGYWARPGDTFGAFVVDVLSVGGITLVATLRATICPF